MTIAIGVLFTQPLAQPFSLVGSGLAGATLQFYYTGTTTAAPIYQDGFLQTPFAGNPTADSTGTFPAIYLDPSITYAVALFNASSVQIGATVDPYVIIPRQWQWKYKAAATSRASSAVLAIDPDLQLAMPAVPAGSSGFTYEYEILLEVVTPGAGGATPGINWQLEYTSGNLQAGFATSLVYVGSMNGAVSGGGALNTTVSQSLTGASALNQLLIRGTLSPSVASTLGFFWSQQNSSANATIINAGSYLRMRQVA